jgi:mannosyl-oligosaccharide alpha-1,2-mannosidase
MAWICFSPKSSPQRNTYLFLGLLFYFQSIVSAFNVSLSEFSAQDVEQANFRRNFIKDMMRHAWHGYANYAWGYNEVRPVSKLPHTESIFGGEKMGATIVDAIDTLYIMGLNDEYLAARTWIELNLDFNKFDVELSVFETNIRYVGGLLSIYALSKDPMFLSKAVQIADKLLPAFDTPSGVPHSNVNVRTGYSRNHDWAYGSAILSEFGSMHLEFIYLSYVTGDPKYREKAFKIRQAIKKAIPRSDGLYNNYMSTDTGQWLARPTHISMGALGDSFYEYLIKSYIQSDGQDVEAYQMYMDAMEAFENKLIFTSTQSRLVYFAELKDTSINHKMDSLACFSGGMLAIGAKKSVEPVRSRHMSLASGITNTCHESCVRTKSHLGPETFLFSSRADAMAYGPSEKYYILRPEILEAYFYMWRYTHDPKYRAWAWDFVEALEKYCKSEAGYSGLRNVYQPVIKDDVQQSFFLAEVLKYLYLIFSDDSVINLDEWVLNTEAHPLPILKRYGS